MMRCNHPGCQETFTIGTGKDSVADILRHKRQEHRKELWPGMEGAV